MTTVWYSDFLELCYLVDFKLIVFVFFLLAVIIVLWGCDKFHYAYRVCVTFYRKIRGKYVNQTLRLLR